MQKREEDSKKRILGDTIKWRRGQVLGAGSFGVVNLGMVVSTGEFVAVKELDLSNFSEGREEFTQSVMKEGNLLKSLEHTNVVQYKGVDVVDDTLYLYMEFVPGGSIAHLLEQFGAFDEQTIQLYTRQILNGIRYLHSQNVMHSDIKGANILVSDKGDVKLCDFGLSSRGTAATGCSGTVMWMAPESMNHQASLESDIWSLGCTILEMATAKPPWAECNFDCVEALMYVIAVEGRGPPIPEGLSDEARDFVKLCLQKDPTKRSSAADLLRHRWISSPIPRGALPKALPSRLRDIANNFTLRRSQSPSHSPMSAGIMEYLSKVVQGKITLTMESLGLEGRPWTAPARSDDNSELGNALSVKELMREAVNCSIKIEAACPASPQVLFSKPETAAHILDDEGRFLGEVVSSSDESDPGSPVQRDRNLEVFETLHALLSRCERSEGIPEEVKLLLGESLSVVSSRLDHLNSVHASKPPLFTKHRTSSKRSLMPTYSGRASPQGANPHRKLPPLQPSKSCDALHNVWGR